METIEEIAIVSQYKGAVWAGKILENWKVKVRYGKPEAGTSLIILNEEQEQEYKEFKGDKIVIKGVEMGSHHVLALSGVLVTFGQQKQYFFPRFIVESCISNSLAIISLQFLYEKKKQKSTQTHITHHISLVEMVKYFGAFNISAKQFGMISKSRGENVLEGGAPFYSVYKCKEGFLAVGNLQPKFYSEMIRGLDLSQEERQFCEEGQHTDEVEKLRNLLTRKFQEKTAEEWEKHYLNYDTCITAIKSPFKSTIREPKVIDLQPKL